MAPIIRVDNLRKCFDSQVAVDGVSFEVRAGQVFGLLGPNGAGKTTTLEMLETLLEPDEGSIIIDGIDARREPWAVRARIGVLLQQSSFHPHLTLVELLRMFSALYQVRGDPEASLRHVQLLDKRHSTFDRLSGGQRQRFSIAVALVNQPRVVFLDEPTSGLDPQSRHHLWELIRRVRDEGTTVVLTTHYMDEAEQLCDQLAILDGGRIVRMAPPVQLVDELVASGFRRPVQPRAATLEDVFLHLTGKQLREG
ncbi:ABC transporter ATP-binding protein [Pyxidicoccus sp. MSG2]|uniref:ABC transporter ATP-binding protein n=1 Tax=Pyxidicoccus sp. MSG2 TaxID=2996790 RepID=UPI00226D92E9|nr:ABC transporter ATP-binding protein [Pyxidicoccus sp. MSG2]MCY1014431.1 ABC transporter ATP-binding protein [Pyxidicoccus sp. MSG2]